MNKAMVYLIPIFAFVILVVCRQVFNLNGMVFFSILLVIIIAIPLLKATAEDRSK